MAQLQDTLRESYKLSIMTACYQYKINNIVHFFKSGAILVANGIKYPIDGTDYFMPPDLKATAICLWKIKQKQGG